MAVADHSRVNISAMDHLWTALYAEPISMADVDVALLEGANVNSINPEHHTHPLEIAIDRGSLDCCKRLLAAGADIHVRATEDGRRVLHRAISSASEHMRIPMLDYLLAAGADPHAQTDQGQSVASWASMWGGPEMVDIVCGSIASHPSLSI
jgi:ankyrin repeat protein